MLRFKTLKKRLAFLLTIGTLASFVLVAAVSYNAIHSIQKNKINTAVASALERFTDQMDRDYYNLMQITQQMMPQGYVGSDVDSYLFADRPYDRSLLTRIVSNNIELITYSYPNVELVMYYDANDRTPLFSNLPPSDDFSVQDLPSLKQNAEITFQPPHPSRYRFSDGQVISVMRKAIFSNGLEVLIYAESKNDMRENFDVIFTDIPYIFLQMDKNGQIKYSSNSDAFKTGQVLKLNSDDSFGVTNGYVWNKKESKHGFINVLLLSAASYNKELYTWGANMSVVTIFLVLIMGVTAIALRRLIYKPLQLFEREMEEVGKGNMDVVDYHTGIEEFDHMFSRFNAMKGQIQNLMNDIENKEKQRHKLEIEKLSYQINPHFLMNALNSAHWMAVMNDQRDISCYISKLNYILSYSLGKTDKNTTLRTEIKMLRTYIELQKMRYDFTAVLDIEEGDYLDIIVPRLILQPLAENAICHGLDENGILTISVCADYEDEVATVVIEDNGKGLDEDTLADICNSNATSDRSFGQGIGLRYAYLMLESFYGSRDLMSIESKPSVGTKVTILLPFMGG